MAVTFSDLHTEEGLKSLNEFLSGKTYISGDQLTKDDIKVYGVVTEKPSGSFPNDATWYDGVSSKLVASFPGTAQGVKFTGSAASAAAAPAQAVRPTLYEAVMEMIDKMGYQVRLVRVTRRVDDAYFAQLYLTKVGKEAECRSFDLRPSDAINIAVRCKVPIQVNKNLVHSDGMRVIESGKVSVQFPGFDGRLLTEMDKPNGQPCAETDEFNLLNNMLKAVDEERYNDAGLVM